jgi:hypothetical protein
MSDTRPFRLGIIGGCMSHQPNIPLNKLYHRQLGKKLAAEHGIHLSVAIARNFNLPYHERMARLLESEHVDGVMLHLRVVFFEKAALFISQKNGKQRAYRLHPFLFRQAQTGWLDWQKNTRPKSGGLTISDDFTDTRNADDHFAEPPPARRLGGFRLREVNLAMGLLFGLTGWAIRDELAMFAQFRAACEERGVPFFVLGPTPITNFRTATAAWQRMNATLKKRTDFPLCLLTSKSNENNETLLFNDGLHLNETGHTYVAGRIYETMLPWFKSTMEYKNE